MIPSLEAPHTNAAHSPGHVRKISCLHMFMWYDKNNTRKELLETVSDLQGVHYIKNDKASELMNVIQ